MRKCGLYLHTCSLFTLHFRVFAPEGVVSSVSHEKFVVLQCKVSAYSVACVAALPLIYCIQFTWPRFIARYLHLIMVKHPLVLVFILPVPVCRCTGTSSSGCIARNPIHTNLSDPWNIGTRSNKLNHVSISLKESLTFSAVVRSLNEIIWFPAFSVSACMPS